MLKGRSKDRSLLSLKKDKDDIESSWSFAQEKISLLEEELQQSRRQIEASQSKALREKTLRQDLQVRLTIHPLFRPV